MGHYRLDRFALAPSGTVFNTTGLPPAAPAGKTFVRPTLSPSAITTLSVALANETDQTLKDNGAKPAPETHSSQTDQQQADAELQRLLAEARLNETDAKLAQAGDPGAPEEKSNTLLYVGIGVGALLLVGGAFFLGKPKKMGGYRKRRSKRSRRR